jgi:hypothetical protein
MAKLKTSREFDNVAPTITISIFSSPKQGRSTIARIIAGALIDLGIKVTINDDKLDKELPPLNDAVNKVKESEVMINTHVAVSYPSHYGEKIGKAIIESTSSSSEASAPNEFIINTGSPMEDDDLTEYIPVPEPVTPSFTSVFHSSVGSVFYHGGTATSAGDSNDGTTVPNTVSPPVPPSPQIIPQIV